LTSGFESSVDPRPHPTAAFLEGQASVVALAGLAVVVGLNVIEWARVEQIGWRAAPAHRADRPARSS
jgi:hypothetical protein